MEYVKPEDIEKRSMEIIVSELNGRTWPEPDFAIVRRCIHTSADFEPKGYLELQQSVAEMGIEAQSLQKVFAILFGRRISKSQRLSNWEADVLTDAQKLYAATDAWACVRIYEELERLKDEGYELR